MNHYYKPGLITNAYTTASSIPNFMFGIVAAGLIATFIPIYSQIIQKEGKERANKFMNNALTSIFIMTIILLAFGLLFTEQLVKINAAGYKGEQQWEAAYDAESSGLPEQQQNKTDEDPEDPVFAKIGY